MKKIKLNLPTVIDKELVQQLGEEFNNNMCDETFIKLCASLRNLDVYFYMKEKYILVNNDDYLEDDYYKENNFLINTIPVILKNKPWLLACPNKDDLLKNPAPEGYLVKTKFKNLAHEVYKYPMIDTGIIFDYWGVNLSFKGKELEAFLEISELIDSEE